MIDLLEVSATSTPVHSGTKVIDWKSDRRYAERKAQAQIQIPRLEAAFERLLLWTKSSYPLASRS